MQWKRAQEQWILVEAPGRWKYFRHLLSYPWTYGEVTTRRLRVYCYMKAYAALVLGYHHLHLFDDARGAANVTENKKHACQLRYDRP
jgi:hypothetical protein